MTLNTGTRWVVGRALAFTAIVSVDKAHRVKKKQCHVTDGGNSSSLIADMSKLFSRRNDWKCIEYLRRKIKFDHISPAKYRLGIKIQNAQATYKGYEVSGIEQNAASFIFFTGLECP